MPQQPRPRPLPRVTYNPPTDPPPSDDPRTLGGDIQGISGIVAPYLNDMAGGLFQGLNNAASYLTGQSTPQQPKTAYGYQDGIRDPNYSNDMFGASRVLQGTDSTRPPLSGASDPRDVNVSPPSSTSPYGLDSRKEDIADARAARIQQARESSINQQIDETTKATDAAIASGDSEALARLQAEWERIAPMAQKYGISADRLVNSYMQPTNAAAKSDLRGALAAAIADDVWAEQATQAFGRPPNQLEWDEHWKAMNVGGRDPLDGHPQAVQNIQARMQQIQNDNQQSSYSDYQKWLGQ